MERQVLLRYLENLRDLETVSHYLNQNYQSTGAKINEENKQLETEKLYPVVETKTAVELIVSVVLIIGGFLLSANYLK